MNTWLNCLLARATTSMLASANIDGQAVNVASWQHPHKNAKMLL
jgi:hypothetical protein